MPTAALSDLTPSLLAFWVGDNDIFAASDAAQAQALGNALAGGPGGL